MRLIDADALKKEWSMGLGSCDDCPQNTRRCQLDMDFTRMDICGMIDDAPTVGGWISVKEKLPEGNGKLYGDGNTLEESVPVLVWGKDEDGKLRFGVCSYIHDHTKPNDSGWNGVIYPIYDAAWCEITHWKPLPEPPKEEER